MPLDYPKNSTIRMLSDEGGEEGGVEDGTTHKAKMDNVRRQAQSSMDKLSATWQ